MKNFCIVFGLLLITFIPLNAQHFCGLDEVREKMRRESPHFQQKEEEMQRAIREYIASNPVEYRTSITIPVVVHIVYNTPAENISDERIHSQIEVLNQDFRRLNADATDTPAEFLGVAADCEINFCLASRDPNGNPTTGITRRETNVSGFTTWSEGVKKYATGGTNAWNRNKYLNIWVCKLTDYGGYAYMPHQVAGENMAWADGIVVHYTAFGVGSEQIYRTLGRTTTHEVGHWLSLDHTFAGGPCNENNDFVDDTPRITGPTPVYICPSTLSLSCDSNQKRMHMNYMDYSSDQCMNLFTQGQKARMHAAIALYRSGLLSSDGCGSPCKFGNDTQTIQAINVTASGARLTWPSLSMATTYNIKWKKNTASLWTSVNGVAGNHFDISGLLPGQRYAFMIQPVCSGVPGLFSPVKYFYAGASCVDSFEPNETRNGAEPIAPGQFISARIGGSNDKDWFVFSNTDAAPNIVINFQASLGATISIFRGTTLLSENQVNAYQFKVLYYNTTTVADDYYVCITGLVASNCYDLQMNLCSAPTQQFINSHAPAVPQSIFDPRQAISAFPNPTSGDLTLTVPVTKPAELSVSLLNTMGALVQSRIANVHEADNRIQLDLENLPPGIYFLHLRSGGETRNIKVAIQR